VLRGNFFTSEEGLRVFRPALREVGCAVRLHCPSRSSFLFVHPGNNDDFATAESSRVSFQNRALSVRTVAIVFPTERSRMILAAILFVCIVENAWFAATAESTKFLPAQIKQTHIYNPSVCATRLTKDSTTLLA
jgi:hypothetical protein